MTEPTGAARAKDDEPTDDEATGDGAETEQRASWLELFFDLVVVVAVSTLTTRIEQRDGIAALAEVLIMYLAIWLVWTSFMLYANVAAERTHRRAMLLAMGCIAVMAAAVPAVDDFDRGRVFAIGYIAARLIASRTWQQTSRVLLDWPIAQMSIGLLPWMASIWVHDPVRWYLWALGLLLDVVFALGANNQEAVFERLRHNDDRTQREDRRRRRADRRGQEYVADGDLPALEAVSVNRSHYGERLGTFTIIVLGEAVTQIVLGASHVDWHWRFAVAAVGSFLLLFGLWWLTFQYSDYTDSAAQVDTLALRISLPLHFLTTTAVVLVAAGLGEIVGEPEDPLGGDLRWLLAGGLAGYLLASQAALAVADWSRPWWLVGLGLLVVAAPLVLAGFGAELEGWILAAALALVVGGQVTYRKLDAGLRPGGNRKRGRLR